jgi:pterin-4a-carbinolamine dehydratase
MNNTETDNRLNSDSIWLKYETLCTEFEKQLNVQNQIATKSGELKHELHTKWVNVYEYQVEITLGNFRRCSY